MSSILIKDMEMPDSCAACPLRNQELFKGGKYVYGCTLCGGWGTGQTRAYDCPLVEIPTPHGGLIDTDKLQACLNALEYIAHAEGGRPTFAEALEEIAKAPTVIEKEE